MNILSDMSGDHTFATVKTGWRNRYLAIFVMVAFITTNQPIFPAYAAGDSQKEIAGTEIDRVEPIPEEIASIKIPKKIGTIQEFYQGNDKKLVMVIQDAHAIPDAQASITQMIRFFQDKYGVRLVGLEGASQTLDPQIFKSFPDQKLLKKVLKTYHDKGEFAGGNAAAIFNPTVCLYHGVENWDLYEKGLEFFLKATAKESVIQTKIHAQKKEIQNRKQRICSKQFLEIDKALERFYENYGSLFSVMEKLAQIEKPEEGSELALLLQEGERKMPSDGESVEIEVRRIADKVKQNLQSQRTQAKTKTLLEFNEKYQQYQTSQITPQAFALFLKDVAARYQVPLKSSKKLFELMQNQKRMQDIQGTKLFGDFERYADGVVGQLMSTEEQKALNRESRELRLLERFAMLELSQDDWKELQGIKIKNINQGPEISGTLLRDSEFDAHFKFYENAHERDNALFENLMKLMQGQNPQPKSRATFNAGMMVAGGFHAEGLTRLLKAHGISYLLVMPQINHVPAQTNYRDQMAGDVSWKDYYRVENGQVDVYKAFVRATRDKLLASGVGRSANRSQQETDATDVNRQTLKAWRDQIIRDLASKDQVARAGEYTAFIDEIAQKEKVEDLKNKWATNVARFVEGLKQLESRGQLNEQNIRNLLKPAAIPAPAVNLGIAPNNPVKEGLILVAQTEIGAPAAKGRSEVRSIQELLTHATGIPTEFLDFMETDHYNSKFHHEGGQNARLRDHLQAMLDVLNQMEKDDSVYSDVPPDARGYLRAWIAKNRPMLEAFILLHDIGKKTKVTKNEAGDHSYVGHEKESFRVLSENDVRYGELDVSKSLLMKLVIREHIYAFAVKNAKDIEKLRTRFAEEGLTDENEFRGAVELLIATTALDLMASHVDDAGHYVPLDPVKRFIASFAKYKKIQDLKTRLGYDKLPPNERSRLDSKYIAALLKNEDGMEKMEDFDKQIAKFEEEIKSGTQAAAKGAETAAPQGQKPAAVKTEYDRDQLKAGLANVPAVVSDEVMRLAGDEGKPLAEIMKAIGGFAKSKQIQIDMGAIRGAIQKSVRSEARATEALQKMISVLRSAESIRGGDSFGLIGPGGSADKIATEVEPLAISPGTRYDLDKKSRVDSVSKVIAYAALDNWKWAQELITAFPNVRSIFLVMQDLIDDPARQDEIRREIERFFRDIGIDLDATDFTFPGDRSYIGSKLPAGSMNITIPPKTQLKPQTKVQPAPRKLALKVATQPYYDTQLRRMIYPEVETQPATRSEVRTERRLFPFLGIPTMAAVFLIALSTGLLASGAFELAAVSSVLSLIFDFLFTKLRIHKIVLLVLSAYVTTFFKKLFDASFIDPFLDHLGVRKQIKDKVKTWINSVHGKFSRSFAGRVQNQEDINLAMDILLTGKKTRLPAEGRFAPKRNNAYEFITDEGKVILTPTPGGLGYTLSLVGKDNVAKSLKLDTAAITRIKTLLWGRNVRMPQQARSEWRVVRDVVEQGLPTQFDDLFLSPGNTVFDEDVIARERELAAQKPTVAFDLDNTLASIDRETDEGYLLRPGIKEELQKLKAAGVRLVLWTYSRQSEAKMFLLQHPDIAEFFDLVITRENYDSPGADRLKKAYAGADLNQVGEFYTQNEGAKDAGLLGYALLVDDNRRVAAESENSPARSLTPARSYQTYRITFYRPDTPPGLYRESINDLADILLAKLGKTPAVARSDDRALQFADIVYGFYPRLLDLSNERMQMLDQLNLPPAIVVLGSNRFPEDHPYYRESLELGVAIHESGEATRNGAAFGAMQAAFEGYVTQRQRRGIPLSDKNATQGVQLLFKPTIPNGRNAKRPVAPAPAAAEEKIPFKEHINPFAERISGYDSFAFRKEALLFNMKGGIVVAGGIGTLDEIFELWRRGRRFIFLGDFWEPVMDAFQQAWRESGIMEQVEERRAPLQWSDSIDDAVKYAAEMPPDQISAERFHANDQEFKEKYVELYKRPRSVVVIGKPSEAGPELGVAENLLNRVVTRYGVPVRVATRRQLFERVHRTAKENGWMDKLEALYYLSDESRPLTPEEQELGDRVISLHDDTSHGYLTASNASAYVFLPGGVGTMNKLFHLLTIMQTKKIDRKPVILVGRKFWQPIMDAVFKAMLERDDGLKLCNEEDRKLFVIVDSEDEVDEAVDLIGASAEHYRERDLQTYGPRSEFRLQPGDGEFAFDPYRELDPTERDRYEKYDYAKGKTEPGQVLEWLVYQDLRDAFVSANGEAAGEFLDTAVKLAEAYHAEADPKPRDDGRPYVVHPIEIALNLALRFGITDRRVILAALFHDLLEDTAAGNVEEQEAIYQKMAGVGLRREDYAIVISIVKYLTENTSFRSAADKDLKPRGIENGRILELYQQIHEGRISDEALAEIAQQAGLPSEDLKRLIDQAVHIDIYEGKPYVGRLATKIEHVNRVAQGLDSADAATKQKAWASYQRMSEADQFAIRSAVMIKVIDRLHNMHTNSSKYNKKWRPMEDPEIDRWMRFISLPFVAESARPMIIPKLEEERAHLAATVRSEYRAVNQSQLPPELRKVPLTYEKDAWFELGDEELSQALGDVTWMSEGGIRKFLDDPSVENYWAMMPAERQTFAEKLNDIHGKIQKALLKRYDEIKAGTFVPKTPGLKMMIDFSGRMNVMGGMDRERLAYSMDDWVRDLNAIAGRIGGYIGSEDDVLIGMGATPTWPLLVMKAKNPELKSQMFDIAISGGGQTPSPEVLRKYGEYLSHLGLIDKIKKIFEDGAKGNIFITDVVVSDTSANNFIYNYLVPIVREATGQSDAAILAKIRFIVMARHMIFPGGFFDDYEKQWFPFEVKSQIMDNIDYNLWGHRIMPYYDPTSANSPPTPPTEIPLMARLFMFGLYDGMTRQWIVPVSAATARSETRQVSRQELERRFQTAKSGERNILIGFMRDSQGKIQPIFSTSANLVSVREAPNNVLGAIAMMTGWNGQREVMEVPLAIKKIAGKGLLSRPSIQKTRDWGALPKRLQEIFDDGNYLETKPGAQGDYSLLMYTTPTKEKTRKGRSGILLENGFPVVIEIDGKEFLVELKGSGTLDGGFELSDGGIAGGVPAPFGQREINNLQLREESETYRQGETLRGAANIAIADGQDYVIRLSPGSIRLSYNHNDAIPKVDRMKAAELFGREVAALLVKGQVVFTHPENLIVSNGGNQLTMTDFSDMFHISELPRTVEGQEYDPLRGIIHALMSVEQMEGYSEQSEELFRAFLKGVVDVFEQTEGFDEHKRNRILSARDFNQLGEILWNDFLFEIYFQSRKKKGLIPKVLREEIYNAQFDKVKLDRRIGFPEGFLSEVETQSREFAKKTGDRGLAEQIEKSNYDPMKVIKLSQQNEILEVALAETGLKRWLGNLLSYMRQHLFDEIELLQANLPYAQAELKEEVEMNLRIAIVKYLRLEKMTEMELMYEIARDPDFVVSMVLLPYYAALDPAVDYGRGNEYKTWINDILRKNPEKIDLGREIPKTVTMEDVELLWDSYEGLKTYKRMLQSNAPGNYERYIQAMEGLEARTKEPYYTLTEGLGYLTQFRKEGKMFYRMGKIGDEAYMNELFESARRFKERIDTHIVNNPAYPYDDKAEWATLSRLLGYITNDFVGAERYYYQALGNTYRLFGLDKETVAGAKDQRAAVVRSEARTDFDHVMSGVKNSQDIRGLTDEQISKLGLDDAIRFEVPDIAEADKPGVRSSVIKTALFLAGEKRNDYDTVRRLVRGITVADYDKGRRMFIGRVLGSIVLNFLSAAGLILTLFFPLSGVSLFAVAAIISLNHPSVLFAGLSFWSEFVATLSDVRSGKAPAGELFKTPIGKFITSFALIFGILLIPWVGIPGIYLKLVYYAFLGYMIMLPQVFGIVVGMRSLLKGLFQMPSNFTSALIPNRIFVSSLIEGVYLPADDHVMHEAYHKISDRLGSPAINYTSLANTVVDRMLGKVPQGTLALLVGKRLNGFDLMGRYLTGKIGWFEFEKKIRQVYDEKPSIENYAFGDLVSMMAFMAETGLKDPAVGDQIVLASVQGLDPLLDTLESLPRTLPPERLADAVQARSEIRSPNQRELDQFKSEILDVLEPFKIGDRNVLLRMLNLRDYEYTDIYMAMEGVVGSDHRTVLEAFARELRFNLGVARQMFGSVTREHIVNLVRGIPDLIEGKRIARERQIELGQLIFSNSLQRMNELYPKTPENNLSNLEDFDRNLIQGPDGIASLFAELQKAPGEAVTWESLLETGLLDRILQTYMEMRQLNPEMKSVLLSDLKRYWNRILNSELYRKALDYYTKNMSDVSVRNTILRIIRTNMSFQNPIKNFSSFLDTAYREGFDKVDWIMRAQRQKMDPAMKRQLWVLRSILNELVPMVRGRDREKYPGADAPINYVLNSLGPYFQNFPAPKSEPVMRPSIDPEAEVDRAVKTWLGNLQKWMEDDGRAGGSFDQAIQKWMLWLRNPPDGISASSIANFGRILTLLNNLADKKRELMNYARQVAGRKLNAAEEREIFRLWDRLRAAAARARQITTDIYEGRIRLASLMAPVDLNRDLQPSSAIFTDEMIAKTNPDDLGDHMLQRMWMRFYRSESRDLTEALMRAKDVGVFHDQYGDDGLAAIKTADGSDIVAELSKAAVYPEFLDRLMQEFDAIIELLPPDQQTAPRIYSIGEGNGVIGKRLIDDQGAAVSGVEASEVQAERARKRGVKVETGLAQDVLPKVPEKSQDIVFIGEAIGYLEPLDVIFEQVKRILADGGSLVITTYPVAKGQEFSISPTGYVALPLEHILGELRKAGFEPELEPRAFYRSEFPGSDIQKYFSRPIIQYVIVARLKSDAAKTAIAPEEEAGKSLKVGQAVEAAVELLKPGVNRSEYRASVEELPVVVLELGVDQFVSRMQERLSQKLQSLEPAAMTSANQPVIDSKVVKAVVSEMFEQVSKLKDRKYTVAYAVTDENKDLVDAVSKIADKIEQLVLYTSRARVSFGDALRKISLPFTVDASLSHLERSVTRNLSPNQKAVGFIANHDNAVQFAADSPFVPIISIPDTETSDPMVNNVMLAMQTVISLLLAEEIKDEAKKKEILTNPAALLKQYNLFSGFEGKMLATDNQGRLTISAQAVQDYLAQRAVKMAA